MIENALQLSSTTHENIVESMSINCENHSSLQSAMGQEKFSAYQYGEGLKNYPQLEEEFSKNGLTNAQYSIGTFRNEAGELETSLFIKSETPYNSVIYECKNEILQYLPFPYNFKMFEVKHMYALGQNGAADLMEELGASDTKVRLCPDKRIPFCGASLKDNSIYIPDLGRLSKTMFGFETMDYAVILHEIGHIKHRESSPGVLENQRRGILNLITFLGVTREKLGQSNGLIQSKLAKLIDEKAPGIIESEEIASSWACKWIEKKREGGLDFSHNDHHWLQLDAALATYKTSYVLEQLESYYNSRNILHFEHLDKRKLLNFN